MGKLDCFTEVNSGAYSVGMSAFSLKIFPLCGKMCPFPFLCGVARTPDEAVINWVCQPCRGHIQLQVLLIMEEIQTGADMGSWHILAISGTAIHSLTV